MLRNFNMVCILSDVNKIYPNFTFSYSRTPSVCKYKHQSLVMFLDPYKSSVLGCTRTVCCSYVKGISTLVDTNWYSSSPEFVQQFIKLGPFVESVFRRQTTSKEFRKQAAPIIHTLQIDPNREVAKRGPTIYDAAHPMLAMEKQTHMLQDTEYLRLCHTWLSR